MNPSGIVLATDLDILRYAFGGVTPPGAASLTGDLGQMVRASNARILQSTSPGAAAVAAGSLAEQIQYMVNQFPITAPATYTPVGMPTLGVSSAYSIGPMVGSKIAAPFAANVTMVANRAIYIPFWSPVAITAKKLFLEVGAPGGTNNLDAGIYASAAGLPTTKLVSIGSTAIAAQVTAQVLDIADQALAALTLYFFAYVQDSVTPKMVGYDGIASGFVGLARQFGCYEQATAFPLPSTATPAVLTQGGIPDITILTTTTS